MGYHLDPQANQFAPGGRKTSQQGNNTAKQVSAPPSSYLQARVLNLEEARASLCEDVNTLKELYHGLSFSVDKLKKGGWPVHVGPFQDVDLNKSHQDAVDLNLELERLAHPNGGSCEAGTNILKANGLSTPKMSSSMPPHLRAASASKDGVVKGSLPPHLRGANKADPRSADE